MPEKWESEQNWGDLKLDERGGFRGVREDQPLTARHYAPWTRHIRYKYNDGDLTQSRSLKTFLLD